MTNFVSFDLCGDLVGTVGTQQFGRALMRAGREVVDADYCSLFAFAADGPPVCLASCGTQTDRHALEASRRYTDRHWRSDPVLSDGATVTPVGQLHRGLDLSVDEAYRAECFDNLNIGDRLLLLFDDDACRLRLSFYRFRTHAAFGDSDVERVVNAGSFFLKAVRRHFGLARAAALNPMNGELSIPLVEERMRQLGIPFSPREIQVCSRILSGMTAEGIALDLEIGHNSVVTYRKRAYAKLGIATQNELFARCLSGFPAV
ncbi:helix-turn-helix transcriptional regulator [Marinibaculum pumilum]|uniref:Helix-turn-helix transcriptional regulator n=1 Tax=Marinibaculum pumilum TaxID=1766165 RepID=A0ABV7L1R5_9PROT